MNGLQLDFSRWFWNANNLFLLNSSLTEKYVQFLKKTWYFVVYKMCKCVNADDEPLCDFSYQTSFEKVSRVFYRHMHKYQVSQYQIRADSSKMDAFRKCSIKLHKIEVNIEFKLQIRFNFSEVTEISFSSDSFWHILWNFLET